MGKEESGSTGAIFLDSALEAKKQDDNQNTGSFGHMCGNEEGAQKYRVCTWQTVPGPSTTCIAIIMCMVLSKCHGFLIYKVVTIPNS